MTVTLNIDEQTKEEILSKRNSKISSFNDLSAKLKKNKKNKKFSLRNSKKFSFKTIPFNIIRPK